MATKKSAAKAPSKSDYVTPEDAQWTDPCPGSVGSPTNLVDVENQVKENENAFRENRKANALAIPCPFCSNYHLEMQPSTESLVGGEATSDFISVMPPPVEEPPVNQEALASAVGAVTNVSNLPVEEEDEDNYMDSFKDLTEDDGTDTSSNS